MNNMILNQKSVQVLKKKTITNALSVILKSGLNFFYNCAFLTKVSLNFHVSEKVVYDHSNLNYKPGVMNEFGRTSLNAV